MSTSVQHNLSTSLLNAIQTRPVQQQQQLIQLQQCQQHQQPQLTKQYNQEQKLLHNNQSPQFQLSNNHHIQISINCNDIITPKRRFSNCEQQQSQQQPIENYHHQQPSECQSNHQQQKQQEQQQQHHQQHHISQQSTAIFQLSNTIDGCNQKLSNNLKQLEQQKPIVSPNQIENIKSMVTTRSALNDSNNLSVDSVQQNESINLMNQYRNDVNIKQHRIIKHNINGIDGTVTRRQRITIIGLNQQTQMITSNNNNNNSNNKIVTKLNRKP